MERQRSVRRGIGAGIVAGIIVSCGPTGMEMVGDAMGGAMVDAGHALIDGGGELRDASDEMTPDAQAQSCGTNCTGGGVQRVMTAESDPMQWEHGSAEVGMSDVPLVSGPIFVTHLDATNQIVNTYISTGSTCTRPSGTLDGFAARIGGYLYGSVYATQSSARGIPVRSGETLCAAGLGGGPTVGWGGYRPYE